MSLATQFAERFRALSPNPTFQITHDPTDPRTLAQVTDDVVAEIKTGAKEAATIHRLASAAATCASIALIETAPPPKPWDYQTIRRANFTAEDFENARLRAEEWGLEAKALILDPVTHTTYTAMFAAVLHALHHAALAVDGWPEVGPVLTVDRPNPLPRRFRNIAAAAAKAFGLVTITASEEAALRAWWQELRRRDYCGPLDVLTQPAEASAQLCEELAEESALEQAVVQTERSSPPVPPTEATMKNGGAPSISALGLNHLSRSVPLAECVFRRVDERWEMVFAGDKAFVVTRLKGFQLIQTLLEHPHSPIDAITLMGTAVPGSNVDVEKTAVSITHGFDGVPAADNETKRRFGRQIAQLTEDKAEALRRDDQERADECQTEIDAIERHLSGSFNHRGQPRLTGGALERARGAARERLQHAYAKIGETHPALKAHLREAIHTGYRCVYEPNDHIQWVTR